MVPATPEDLREAYRSEKNPRVIKRMAAVNMVCVCNMSVQDVADCLMQCPTWVSKWVRRYREAGIDGLRDLPRGGRPPAIPHGRMDSVMGEAECAEMTPVMLQQKLAQEHGVCFHLSYVRKIMRRYGMTPKTAVRVHANLSLIHISEPTRPY